MAEQATCASCGKDLEPADRGRPRRYCSRACQARAYRARRTEETTEPGPAPARSPTAGPPAGDDSAPHLSAERIARAGIDIADAEGLEALSMRRVATGLGASTMALYRYVTSKDDLVAIMVEAALSDVPLPDTPPQNWRHGLERAARRDWELYHRHPWILAKVLVTTRAHFSPALAADSESAFSSFDGLGLEPADAFRYMFMFASYVQGVALTYVSDVEAERQSANAARRKGTSPEAVRAPLFAPGAYPRFGPAMRAGADPWDLDALFLAGLAGVLDGIEADLARRDLRGRPG
ncbi:TetR/AcrR family transcriptional regulator [Streptomyces sp. NBC_00257]|uniref:TetR/AcrR family transcriptional regulator C-terminal domain-containing protein n=1 Tax=unclassified Streptomyces TaxID=2593676 RepID=UPI00224D9F51|nr:MULTISPECIES: TetR/AcrR family transcriptional regulator C-terminal domain-containing protein [unclassified Streptomyces]WTB54452.1 TetR/AcrR family transcriptional regulator [Streptomyces sp. NBC_00826]WTH92661.1 TetR/AcrR family transcriptional regulator [Streptomyces sp. NBC_00825]WTI01392.1 TetR/AcrR family transcriptional regulator [Streptomyces sp. NBC_00822]MCX4866977.1 TetR/AcrR family transcriptional regulator [Streptomyces sp. NBC_00906]MCX4898215.1 TetR/AcrR family transcriptiona